MSRPIERLDIAGIRKVQESITAGGPLWWKWHSDRVRLLCDHVELLESVLRRILDKEFSAIVHGQHTDGDTTQAWDEVIDDAAFLLPEKPNPGVPASARLREAMNRLGKKEERHVKTD